VGFGVSSVYYYYYFFTANGFVPGGSGTTIRHSTQKQSTAHKNKAHHAKTKHSTQKQSTAHKNKAQLTKTKYSTQKQNAAHTPCESATSVNCIAKCSPYWNLF
jgi:hypothetical protein